MTKLAAPHPDAVKDISGVTDHVLDRLDPLAAGELIAHVLRRAHEAAESLNSPDEARAILHVAGSFADELAETSPGFDRVCFIKAATGLG